MSFDETPVAIDDALCLRVARKALLFRFESDGEYQTFEHWIPTKLIVPGVLSQPGHFGTLPIPNWFWRRILGEELRKAPPPVEFQTDRYFQKLLLLCETRDAVSTGDCFDLLGPMYLEMRRELHAAQEQVREAGERIVEMAQGPVSQADMLALADVLLCVEVEPVEPVFIEEAFDAPCA